MKEEKLELALFPSICGTCKQSEIYWIVDNLKWLELPSMVQIQLAKTCSKLTMETSEPCVKSVQSKQLRNHNVHLFVNF